MNNYKVQATALDLADTIKQRTGLATVVDVTGTDYSVITVGTATTGNAGATIRVQDQRGGDATGAQQTGGWNALPGSGFSNAGQPVYTGSNFQIVVENISGAGAFPITLAHLIKIIGECTKRGGKTELLTVNSGQNPTFAGAGLAVNSVFENNLYWPLQDRA